MRWPVILVLASAVLAGELGVLAEPRNDFNILNFGATTENACPKLCTCSGTSVDCSERGLLQVPENIPGSTEKL